MKLKTRGFIALVTLMLAVSAFAGAPAEPADSGGLEITLLALEHPAEIVVAPDAAVLAAVALDERHTLSVQATDEIANDALNWRIQESMRTSTLSTNVTARSSPDARCRDVNR